MGLTRQELYNLIKASSKEGYILSEMKRLGFWDADKPSVAEDLIQEKFNLQRHIQQLSGKLKDPEKVLAELQQERMAAARARRIETKVKREGQRYKRVLAWHQRKQNEIITLGDAASFGPVYTAQRERLTALGLPFFETPQDLATAAGISLNELRFLTYTNKVSKISHYQRFELPKKTGGSRLISAPMPRLKRIQYWVLDHILAPQSLSDQAHGFAAGRSIVTNATPHVGQTVVINFDLQDFFPSISYPRVRGLFAKMGYNAQIATLLALLCTEPDSQWVTLDGEDYVIASRQRRLPQGAPTSPALTNLLCRSLDRRLQGLARRQGFVYTRYADDLTFSSQHTQQVGGLLKSVQWIVQQEGFQLHPQKTRVMHKSQRQEVTGLVVNQKTAIERKVLRRFRALLHQLEHKGLAACHWGQAQSPEQLLHSIEGFARYLKMVHPQRGQAALQRIHTLRKKEKLPARVPAPKTFRQRAAQGQLPLPHQTMAQPQVAPALAEVIENPALLEAVQKWLEENP